MNKREVEEIGNEFAEKLSDGRVTDAMLLLMKLGKPIDAAAVLLWVWNETGVSADEVRKMAKNWERLWEATKIVLERNAYHCTAKVLVLANSMKTFGRFERSINGLFDNLMVEVGEVDEVDVVACDDAGWSLVKPDFDGEMAHVVALRSDDFDVVVNVYRLLVSTFWASPLTEPVDGLEADDEEVCPDAGSACHCSKCNGEEDDDYHIPNKLKKKSKKKSKKKARK